MVIQASENQGKAGRPACFVERREFEKGNFPGIILARNIDTIGKCRIHIFLE